MADTINVNIIDRSVPINNHVNIAVVNVPNPAMNVTVDGDQLYNLINIPKYFITDATTGTPITGSNYEDYFPSGGGGGGGGGSITIDNFPTEGSENAVSSGGTYSFVNSSVSTNTANFIGTFSSVADLEAYSGTVTNNDYAFVIGTDANGNTKYDRYKYTDSSDPASWEYEYTLNNSSFTAAEWATIQSGLTAADKTKYDGYETVINSKSGLIESSGGEIFNSYSGEGKNTASGSYSHAEGYSTTTSGNYSHTEGYGSTATADYAHAEGSSHADGYYSHAEGTGSTASGSYSHSEGENTTASNSSSHAEGSYTTASGMQAHAEGNTTTAYGAQSHAEGAITKAMGPYSHAEGNHSIAGNSAAHAEGTYTVASGENSHAEGSYTTAQRKSQHVEGEYNVLDTDGTSSTRGKFAHIIGNGTADDARSNAYAIGWDGKIYQPSDPNADANGVYLSSKANSNDLSAVATSGSFSDLSNKPSASSEGGSGKYIQSIEQNGGVISATAVSLDTTVSSSTSIAPTSNAVYQPVLENINNGVKNISQWSGGTATSANQTIATKIPITTDGDTYVISYATSLTTGYITVGIKDANDALVVNAIQIDNFGTKTAVVTIPSNAAYFNIVSSVAGTYSNFMICKKKLYDISEDYRPYAPSNSELYSMFGDINSVLEGVL